MKKANIRELHMRTSPLVKEAANGEVIVIEKRGVAVAKLSKVHTVTWADAFRDLKRQGYFKRMGKTNTQIDRIISEGRDR
jgi:antitoxin (DNA-binding transcriptional repressor) of toxin-antitoxin stability system